jgi:hypothetical protein
MIVKNLTLRLMTGGRKFNQVVCVFYTLMFDAWSVFLEVKNVLWVVLCACLQVVYGVDLPNFLQV